MYLRLVLPLLGSVAAVDATCSGEGTIMPGEYCGPMADVYGEKCCSDGGHSCVYVNASEYFCLPCDHNDMHSVAWGDADRHCNENPNCEYDFGTSKCKNKPAACSGEGTIMPGEYCGPMADVYGEKCCTDGGHS